MSELTYVVYRAYYGGDYIKEAVNSVIDDVDKVLIYAYTSPWFNVQKSSLKGKVYNIPKNGVDDLIPEALKLTNHPKVHLIHDNYYEHHGQMAHLINDRVLKEFPRPKYIIYENTDQIHLDGGLRKLLDEFKECGNWIASPHAIHTWRNLKWKLPDEHRFSHKRLSSLFINTHLMKEFPKEKQHEAYLLGDVPRLTSAKVVNVGFSSEENLMLYKVLLRKAHADLIPDARPLENWYDDVWLGWKNGSGNKLGWCEGEGDIGIPIPLNDEELPQSLIDRRNCESDT